MVSRRFVVKNGLSLITMFSTGFATGFGIRPLQDLYAPEKMEPILFDSFEGTVVNWSGDNEVSTFIIKLTSYDLDSKAIVATKTRREYLPPNTLKDKTIRGTNAPAFRYQFGNSSIYVINSKNVEVYESRRGI